MTFKPAGHNQFQCLIVLALCLFFLVPALNAETDQVEVIRLGGGDWGYRLLFNRNRPGPARGVEVRQAFAYAIDLGELVTKGAGFEIFESSNPAQILYTPQNHSHDAHPSTEKYAPGTSGAINPPFTGKESFA